MTYQTMNQNFATIYTDSSYTVSAHLIDGIIQYAVSVWNGINYTVIATTGFYSTIERMMQALLSW